MVAPGNCTDCVAIVVCERSEYDFGYFKNHVVYLGSLCASKDNEGYR